MVLAISAAVLAFFVLRAMHQAIRDTKPGPSPELRSLLRIKARTSEQRAAYIRRLVDEAQKNGARDLIYDDDQPND